MDLSRKAVLEIRIMDLKSRLEEIDGYTVERYEWMVSGFEELHFSREELATVAPQDFYTVREIQRAIDLAEEELKYSIDETQI